MRCTSQRVSWSFLLLAAVAACGSKGEASAPDHIYTVRGIVQQLPSGGDGRLHVRHEAIDEFVNREGKVTGMDAMSMPFAVAEGVALSGVEVNDKVELTFELRWGGDPTLKVTRIEELPPGTALEFRAAKPPGS